MQDARRAIFLLLHAYLNDHYLHLHLCLLCDSLLMNLVPLAPTRTMYSETLLRKTTQIDFTILQECKISVFSNNSKFQFFYFQVLIIITDFLGLRKTTCMKRIIFYY